MTTRKLTDVYECWFTDDDRESAETLSASSGERAAEEFARKNDEYGSDGSVTDVCVAEKGADKVITYAVRLHITWDYTARKKS